MNLTDDFVIKDAFFALHALNAAAVRVNHYCRANNIARFKLLTQASVRFAE